MMRLLEIIIIDVHRGFIQGETEGLRYVFSQKLKNGLALNLNRKFSRLQLLNNKQFKFQLDLFSSFAIIRLSSQNLLFT